MKKQNKKLNDHIPISPRSITINKNSCEGCGKCIIACKNKVLEIHELTNPEFSQLSLKGKIKTWVKGRKKAYVKNTHSCTFCGNCKKSCHESAIRIS